MSVTDTPETLRSGVDPHLNGDGVAAEAADKAGRIRQALQDGARRGAEAARAQTAAVGRKLSQATQERPVTSVSTAAAVGLVAGFLLGFCVAQAFANDR